MMSDSGPYALLSAFYDPPTQRAVRVDLNQRMAELLGMPLETAPALLEAYGRALVMPAWDCLCALVDASLNMSTTAVVRYFRMCSGHRRPCRPFLVCGSIEGPGIRCRFPRSPAKRRKARRNSASALTLRFEAQVRYALRPISAGEYDAAVENTPHLCPLAVMGDLRSGRELLASAARDLKTAPFAESTRAASCSHTLLRRFLAARCAELQEQLRQSDGARRPVRDSCPTASPTQPPRRRDPSRRPPLESPRPPCRPAGRAAASMSTRHYASTACLGSGRVPMPSLSGRFIA